MKYQKQIGAIFILGLLFTTFLFSPDPDKIVVKVGFLDTGVEFPNNSVEHKSFVSRDNYYQYDEREYDLHLHGTTTYELFMEQIELLGIENNIKVFSAKVLDKNGLGSEVGISKGMDWLIDNNVGIIAMSLGAEPTIYNIKRDQIDAYANSGGIVVASSGNEGFVSYVNGLGDVPAIYPNVIGVGAINLYGTIAYYTSRGKSTLDSYVVEFVESGNPNNNLNEGTSFSVPRLVAKIAYLQLKSLEILGYFLDVNEMGAIMGESTGLPFSKEYGWGVVDVERSVELLIANETLIKYLYDPTIEYTRVVDELTTIGSYYRNFNGYYSPVFLIDNCFTQISATSSNGWKYLQYRGVAERGCTYNFGEEYELPFNLNSGQFTFQIDLTNVRSLYYGRYGAFSSFEEGLRLQGFEVDYKLPYLDNLLFEPSYSEYDIIYYPFQNTIWETNIGNSTMKIVSYSKYLDTIKNQLKIGNHTGNIIKLNRYEKDEISLYSDNPLLSKFVENLPTILFEGVGLNITTGIPVAWNEFGDILLYYLEDIQTFIYGSSHGLLDHLVKDTETIFNNLLVFFKKINSA